MAWIITIGGKKFGSDYLGIKESDVVAIDRNIRRIVKSSDGGITWEIVNTPENYGYPSLSIFHIN